ncbi:MAG: 6-carboxytetrahydropterin synthase [Myxococcales bacterium]|nr:6-carboxytetrahydropterin synthase [Myxococcales bacterium]
MIETRRFTYFAHHRLYDPNLSEAENDELFGICARGHGHSYTIAVSLDLAVASWGAADDRVRRVLEAILDYTDLNQTVGGIPTGERLVVFLWDRLRPVLAPGALVGLRVEETGRNYFEFAGDA